MGIRKLDWDNWIEMDSNYKRYHDLKVSELEKDIDAHVQYYDDDVTKDACFEMLEELTRYLTHRYPRIFYLADGLLHNSVTGEKLRYPAGRQLLRLADWISESPKEALATSARLVQDDLVLMVKRDGKSRAKVIQ
jgi:hypothetical protein